jgi:hypothetical protein
MNLAQTKHPILHAHGFPAGVLERWSNGVLQELGFVSFLLDHNTPILHSSSAPVEIFPGKSIHLEQRVKGSPAPVKREGALPGTQLPVSAPQLNPAFSVVYAGY